ncbi:hypothetical protein XELAEV_18037469mg [Xenopus laevis]|uniref:Uncharacterized protein n=1 Tax=Xenopus laevis TaxID=8355 RepID=A0A974CDG1_XENLA|nr:hypothetical protein XELAEV_18037469mg [Xenopus laevis]
MVATSISAAHVPQTLQVGPCIGGGNLRVFSLFLFLFSLDVMYYSRIFYIHGIEMGVLFSSLNVRTLFTYLAG